jgi:hypothetical protein
MTFSSAITSAAWRSSDWYAARARRQAAVFGVIALGLAVLFGAAIVITDGSTNVVLALLAAFVGAAVFVEPAVGVYLLFGIALLFEQFVITGLEPITAQTRLYQNLSAYTPLPIRLSLTDLLVIFTLGCWAVRRAARGEAFRIGPLGRAVLAYAGVFIVGGAIGAARGGRFDTGAAFAELHGPLIFCVLYFLSANLIRTRLQIVVLMWEFLALLGVKAFQAVLNYQDAQGSSFAVDSVTAHEDVIFYGLATALLIVMTVLGTRTKFFYALVAMQPLILSAEFVAARRAGFVAVGAVLLAMALLFMARDRRRGLMLVGLVGVAAVAYMAAFWDAEGPLAAPLRAVRSVIEPSSVNLRDAASNFWRDIENQNIAYTVKQLPLTGVGLGQQYLFQREPVPLTGFPYWRYETHNAVLWLWLKAGPLGAFVLWFLVARVLLLGSALYLRLRDPELRWMAVLPVALIVLQVVFSSVDLGLTYSRTMIILGTVLGITAFLALSRSEELAAAPATRGAR